MHNKVISRLNSLKSCVDEAKMATTLSNAMEICDKISHFLPGSRTHKNMLINLMAEFDRHRIETINSSSPNSRIESIRTRFLEWIDYLKDDLEKNSMHPEEKLIQGLEMFDFRKQIPLVRRSLRKSQAIGFYINGEPRHGQLWLAKRIARFEEVQFFRETYIEVDLSGGELKLSLDGFVTAVGNQLEKNAHSNINSDESFQEIQRKLIQKASQHPIVFIIKKPSDCPNQSLMRTILQEFWVPLCHNLTEKSKKVLFLIVDYKINPKIIFGDGEIKDNVEKALKGEGVIGLPPNEPITVKTLERWQETLYEFPFHSAVHKLFEYSRDDWEGMLRNCGAISEDGSPLRADPNDFIENYIYCVDYWQKK